jgi:CubicO group peptidase (beta-lactamase class C family)
MLGSSLGAEGVPVVLRVKVPSELVCGDVDEGYGAVADAFRRNFARGEEIGAACAIYQDGRAVVDLRGGYRDGQVRSLWEADTMVSVFSATKGMAGAAMAVAHARGLFDLDEQVASYWPEFGTNGGTGEPRTIARV